jgi:hypothetical protein
MPLCLFSFNSIRELVVIVFSFDIVWDAQRSRTQPGRLVTCGDGGGHGARCRSFGDLGRGEFGARCAMGQRATADLYDLLVFW